MYATYTQRALALLIDVLILFIPVFLVQIIISQIVPGVYLQSVVSTLFAGGLMAGYNYYFLRSTGQTLGKKVLKIKVVSSSNKPLSQEQIIKREIHAKFAVSVICSLVPILGALVQLVYFVAAYFYPLFNSKSQTFMDKYADTVVVPA
jgi:uncharacterized RDD family membrane protein YckC